jgi:hypothetical protein
MKKLALTSLAALTLSLAAVSGAQAVEALPIVKVAPPGATSPNYRAAPTSKRIRCLACDRRPPVGRYPPGYTPPAASGDYQPPVRRYPPGSVVRKKADSPPADQPIEK